MPSLGRGQKQVGFLFVCFIFVILAKLHGETLFKHNKSYVWGQWDSPVVNLSLSHRTHIWVEEENRLHKGVHFDMHVIIGHKVDEEGLEVQNYPQLDIWTWGQSCLTKRKLLSAYSTTVNLVSQMQTSVFQPDSSGWVGPSTHVHFHATQVSWVATGKLCPVNWSYSREYLFVGHSAGTWFQR